MPRRKLPRTHAERQAAIASLRGQMTKPMKDLARQRRNNAAASTATLKALEARDMIKVRRSGRWNWTPLGRAVVSPIEAEGA